MLFAGRNAAWLLGCRITADLLNFVLFLVVSRRFGPEGMGVYAYGFAIAGFVYAGTTLGIDDYGVREYVRRMPAARPGLMADLLGTQSCIMVIAIIALAVYVLLTQPSPATLSIILSLTLYQLCSALAATLFVPSMAEQQMVLPAVVILLCRAFAMIAAVVMIWMDASLPVALAAFGVAGVLLSAAALRSAVAHGVRPRVYWSTIVLRDGARALWTFAAAEVMGQSVTRIGVIVLSLAVGQAAAGIYATGLKFAEAACMPLLFAGIAAYPRLCRAFPDPIEFRRLSRRAMSWGFAIALVGALVVYFVVPMLIVPLLGPRYAAAAPVIGEMGVLIFVMGIEIVLARLLLAANLQSARAAWLTVGALMCATATILVAPTYGVAGAIVVVVTTYVLIDLLYASSLSGVLRRAAYQQVAVRS